MTSHSTLVLDNGLEVTLRGSVKVTGGQLAALFWGLPDDEQAEFFSSLPSVAGAGHLLANQMSAAADKTDGGGRAVMVIIGDMAK